MTCRVLVAVLVAACSSKSTKQAPPAPSEPPPAVTPAPATARGVDRDGMDRSIKPGDDFFAHANGGWLKRTEIPADRSGYSTGAILAEQIAKRTSDLVQEAAQKAAPGTDAAKVGDYYASYMDEAGIEAKGAAPLQPVLDAIAAIKDAKGLARFLGESVRADVDGFNNTDLQTPNIFGVWIAQDLDDPSRYVPFLMQGGLGMPDRDYYLDAAPRMAGFRDKYVTHIAAALKLAGLAEPDTKAKRIFELELKLAKAHASRVDSSEVTKGNNHWARKDFAARAPGLDWDAFLAGAGLDKQPMFIVWQPSSVVGVAAAVKSVPLATWKEYLALRAIDNASPVLAKAFVDEHFAFYSSTLLGVPQQRERWKRAVDATSEAMGEPVGRLFVERYFPASEKARAEEMVKNELAAMAKRIDKLAWMTPATKDKAKAKLAVLRVGVGYPDKWRDYTGLEVVRGDALGNQERAARFEYQHHLGKLGKPVDRGEWVMNAHLVNAVNLPAMNAMNFPAGILQPPYFDPARPAVMDYGAIGAIIGHEISHSFDDQGALFDAAGKLANWWTPEDLAHFKAAADQLVKQYDAYKPFPDANVNGTLTLGENIADVAGLAIAYDAYRISLGGKEAPTVDGVTGDQQFFLSFAQAWRSKYREPALRNRILTDGHSPGEYRADTVRNLDAWYTAFDVKPNESLYLAPADRVRIW